MTCRDLVSMGNMSILNLFLPRFVLVSSCVHIWLYLLHPTFRFLEHGVREKQDLKCFKVTPWLFCGGDSIEGMGGSREQMEGSCSGLVKKGEMTSCLKVNAEWLRCERTEYGGPNLVTRWSLVNLKRVISRSEGKPLIRVDSIKNWK